MTKTRQCPSRTSAIDGGAALRTAWAPNTRGRNGGGPGPESHGEHLGREVKTKLTREIELNSHEEAIKLLGRNGELRKRIQQDTPVRIVDRGAKILIIGEEPDTAMVGSMLSELLDAVRKGHTPDMADVSYVLNEARQDKTGDLGSVLSERPRALRREMQLKPRTRGQKAYLDALKQYDVTIAVGPAGTGKTFLAVAAAVSALLNKEVNRIILTRPAVEAGENLGFLPGDLEQKVHPYIRPLYDALYAMLDVERVRRLIEREMIEIAPLAFMRGRTLSHSFAILDEAQNTTSEQMKMFLTRLGEGSRAVITGDITQIDLPKGKTSGLVEARRVLSNAEGVAVIDLGRGDVVRHPLVQNIIEAYERDAEDREAGEASPAGVDKAEGDSPEA